MKAFLKFAPVNCSAIANTIRVPCDVPRPVPLLLLPLLTPSRAQSQPASQHLQKQTKRRRLYVMFPASCYPRSVSVPVCVPEFPSSATRRRRWRFLEFPIFRRRWRFVRSGSRRQARSPEFPPAPPAAIEQELPDDPMMTAAIDRSIDVNFHNFPTTTPNT